MSFLLSALSTGSQCDLNYKQAKDQRLHTELWLMKLANLRNLLNWETLPELPLNGTRNGDSAPMVRTIDQPVAEKKNSNPQSSPDQSGDPGASSPLTEKHPSTSEPVNSYRPAVPLINGAIANGTTAKAATNQNGHTTTAIVNDDTTVTAPAKPRIAPPTRPASSRLRPTVALTAGPSLATADSEEAVEVKAPARPDKPFSFEDLQDVWVTFAKIRHQQNDITSEQVILNRDLILDGTTIHLTLDNTLQVGYLTELKPDLLGYLRNELQNSQIQIEHKVTVQEAKKMIYSSQDKFNYLAEKNPALHELRKVLNLEVDY